MSATAPASSLPDAKPRLELRGVSKRLGGATVVNRLDLSIAQGESVVLLGPSGCGKTTTLRMVAGFLHPEEGEIWLDGALAAGRGLQLPPEKRRLGMVFQTYAVWPHKSVFDNVAYGLQIAGLPKAIIAERVDAMLATVELGGLAERRPAELSGGQQQRVALARALVTEPTLLLLDEPLSNLDASLRQSMRFELKELQQRIGVTTLYVTHDQEEALVLADRVVVMNFGQIEQVGTPEDVYHRPASRFVASFIGSANLVEGTVVAPPANDRARIRLDIGPEFEVPGSPDVVANLRAGDRRTIVLRPEAIDVTAMDARVATLLPQATLLRSHFLGNRHEVRLQAGNVELRADVRTLPHAAGSSVGLAVADGSGWILP
jgi:ABC-type Fe3+/spermidine/putrescine transport system ATPase subunit